MRFFHFLGKFSFQKDFFFFFFSVLNSFSNWEMCYSFICCLRLVFHPAWKLRVIVLLWFRFKISLERIKCLEVGHLEGNWIMRALHSSLDYFIVTFIAQCATRRWGLVGGGGSLEACFWRVYLFFWLFPSLSFCLCSSWLPWVKQLPFTRPFHHAVSAWNLMTMDWTLWNVSQINLSSFNVCQVVCSSNSKLTAKVTWLFLASFHTCRYIVVILPFFL